MTQDRSILLRDMDAATNALSLPWHFDEEPSEYTRGLSYEDSDMAIVSLSVAQRIAGALSLLGGLYIFLRAWKRRHGAFDRIMMGKKVWVFLLLGIRRNCANKTATPNTNSDSNSFSQTPFLRFCVFAFCV